MIKTIHKYQATAGPVSMPIGAKFLAVQVQHEIPQMWFEVEHDSTTYETRNFAIYGTDHTIPDKPHQYLGTFQLDGGSYVLHLYELL